MIKRGNNMIDDKEIKSFLNKFTEDADFADKIASLEEPDEVIDTAKKSGIILSMEDLMSIRDLFKKLFQRKNQSELFEKDLEQISGGISTQHGFDISSRELEMRRLLIMMNKMSTSIISQTEQKVLQKNTSLTSLLRMGR